MTPLDPPSPPPLELWGGVECAHVRVGDEYRDQLRRSGHTERCDDLDLFAALGMRAMRYPILWEHIAPHGVERADWSWADQRLHRLRALRIRPIVGLLHHGSGPRGMSLLDPAFPEELARYAQAVARRYPWVESYTPVNEPLTTARFAGLYGFWHPHGRDALTCMRLLLAQCRAVALAMQAIRTVTPTARLVQTEDVSKTHSTPTLAHQADFENERRWLTFDLLRGAVGPGHPMWSYLRSLGLDERAILWFQDHPCPPDLLGIDHYITSERFLDERLGRYPAATHGGNGRDAYADVEAVRVCAEAPLGYHGILREAWGRYALPMAITEAHLASTREEQLRWFYEAWAAAGAVRAEGGDVRAVTAWSLLGAYDWNSVLTRVEGYYEPGAFDLRSARPRPTAVATLLRALATGQPDTHPVLSAPGWWRRPDRLEYPAVSCSDGACPPPPSPGPTLMAARPVLIVCGHAALQDALTRLCRLRGLAVHLLSQAEMSRATPDDLTALLRQVRPWAVVDAGGDSGVERAERQPLACYRVNVVRPALLATACAAQGTPLLTFSSALVFDGRRSTPYLERDPVTPLSVYGRCKAEGDKRVLAACPGALVARTGACFGPWDRHNWLTRGLEAVASGHPIMAPKELTSLTYLPDLIHTALDVLIDGASGLWQLANGGATTWAALAQQAARQAGLPTPLVHERSRAELGCVAAYPAYSVLDSERGTLLPSLEDALGRYMAERGQQRAA